MLELRDIVRGYRDRPVLDGASLTCRPGEVTCVAGANGAGKTTLLRVACGLLEPQRGEVRIDGTGPADGRRFRSRIGVLPAGNGGLYARLDVAEHLRLFAALGLIDAGRRPAAIAAAVKRFGLAELLDRRVDRLSTGQRQRVRLATAVIHEPDVLLLDEPHSSLDDDALGLLAALLDEHAGAGGSVVWLAPDATRAGLRADAVHVLRNGRVEPA